MNDRAQREAAANRKPGDSAFVSELFKSADPAVAGFMARHSALLERVTVLERALENIVAYIDSDPSSDEDPPEIESHIRWLASKDADA